MKYCFQQAWIGLYDDWDSWRWSLSDTSFYKHGETEFTQWGPGQPDNLNNEQHCVRVVGNGLWGDSNCENHFKAVCLDVGGENIN